MQHELLWEMTSPSEAILMHQLVFKKPDGTLVHVPIRAGKLLQDLSRFGDAWKRWELLVCIADTSQEAELQAALGPALEGMGRAPINGAENAELDGEMKAQISLPYLQAISKIAFHFVLAHFHFTGFESEFEDLKRFIYCGTGASRARIVEEATPSTTSSGRGSSSSVVTYSLRQNSILMDFSLGMQFFAGPRLKPFVWRIDLGLESFSSLAGDGSGSSLFRLRAVRSVWIFRWHRRTSMGPKMVAKL